MTLLEVEDLTVALPTRNGWARAVRDLSFSLDRGQTLGLVGESGCGKSMTALALMGLLPDGARASGRVALDGQELLTMDEADLCRIRGNRIAMIFQEPMTALNPLQPIGRQVAEPLRLHRGASRADAEREAVRLLDRVGLPNAGERAHAPPHMLSGGQRQRAMIAMALACEPDLLVADEPTTALDVTIQGQILDLVIELVDERGMGLILITHDLGVIAETVDRVIVMYGGAGVEEAGTEALFQYRAHPYSQGLFAALPQIGLARRARLEPIPGTVPDLADLPAACTFVDRCPIAAGACRAAPPPPLAVGPGHRARCIRLDEARRRSIP
ncbi:peptide/nickel transport system ATP-binding protein [Stella humosa]|uniref:Peptide/nickel transport system ATP-binding protein n=1 Tax=Stella humosa TaxID=94 RepID=A0A3N1M9F3_9PROT|nr:ABC transporter ATP-binding protein [Stella humosa]ROQ00278.1 peptide/nickel transport system ATP-binding protein [Stella humosa]BBK30484.1 ABC transporter ATP-binding protein [Stella humosa]